MPRTVYTNVADAETLNTRNPLSARQIGSQSPLTMPIAPPSSAAQVFSHAHRIVQEQKSNFLVKKWATDQLN